jgi:hypothetical protein
MRPVRHKHLLQGAEPDNFLQFPYYALHQPHFPTILHFLYTPTPLTSLFFLFFSSKFLLFFLLFSVFIFFFVFFVFFSSSSAPCVAPSFLLFLLHLPFHTDHIVDLSAQNTNSDTSQATALSKTDRNLLISNGQPHLWSPTLDTDSPEYTTLPIHLLPHH